MPDCFFFGPKNLHRSMNKQACRKNDVSIFLEKVCFIKKTHSKYAITFNKNWAQFLAQHQIVPTHRREFSAPIPALQYLLRGHD